MKIVLGADQLLRAFARLPAALGARLEVVGMGSLRPALAGLATTLGVGASVRFLGAVDDDPLLAAYARADVFVMPGTAELQSLATLEAMAAGLPVVAADAMALPHLVRPGVNGRLYAPGDVAALADDLTALLADPVLRARLGRAGRTIAETHALGATVAAFEDRYARLAATRTGVRAPDLSLAAAA
jgi:phosphatidylinositol alpha 1,6-mannosyltransferase